VTEKVSYIHHTGIVSVYPKCKFLLMSKTLQVHRGKLPKQEPGHVFEIRQTLTVHM